jgi:hypothetical protein
MNFRIYNQIEELQQFADQTLKTVYGPSWSPLATSVVQPSYQIPIVLIVSGLFNL